MPSKRRFAFLASALFFAFLFSSFAILDLGCGGATTSPTPSTSATISYATDIQPIWNVNCTSSNCHFGGGQGGLVLTSGVSYNELTLQGGSQNGPVVTANDPDGSILVKKLGTNPPFGSRMPVGGALSPSDIQQIRDWIEQGAEK